MTKSKEKKKSRERFENMRPNISLVRSPFQQGTRRVYQNAINAQCHTIPTIPVSENNCIEHQYTLQSPKEASSTSMNRERKSGTVLDVDGNSLLFGDNSISQWSTSSIIALSKLQISSRLVMCSIFLSSGSTAFTSEQYQSFRNVLGLVRLLSAISWKDNQFDFTPLRDEANQ